MSVTWANLMNKLKRRNVVEADPATVSDEVAKAESIQALEALNVVDTVEVSWEVAERMGLDMAIHTDDDYKDHEG